MKGGKGMTCDNVCADSGRVCNSAQQSSLTSNTLVAAAFLEAGYTCKSFHGDRSYPGTPFSKETDNDDCAPMSSGSTSSCTGNEYSYNSPLCYCEAGKKYFFSCNLRTRVSI